MRSIATVRAVAPPASRDFADGAIRWLFSFDELRANNIDKAR